MNPYMVEMTLPDILTDTFMSLIPEQREKVSEWMDNGFINSYMLSMDRTSLWIVISAESEDQVHDILDSLPLTIYMDFMIHELMFQHQASFWKPSISLN